MTDSAAETRADLRARIARLEGGAPRGPEAALALGLAALDGALPGGGLRLGALHEASGPAGPATGFAAWVGARLAGRGRGPLLWVAARPDLYAPGLAPLGLTPDRLIVALSPDPGERAWAVEEGLACAALGGVIGELPVPDLTRARRLQLLAEAQGVTLLLLAEGDGDPATGATAATTRWRVEPLPGDRWQVELRRARRGRPARLIVQLDPNGRPLDAWPADATERDMRPAALGRATGT